MNSHVRILSNCRDGWVEFVGPVPSFSWLTRVVVRLPAGLADKPSALMSITVHGVTSNQVLITIKAP